MYIYKDKNENYLSRKNKQNLHGHLTLFKCVKNTNKLLQNSKIINFK